MRWMIPTTTSRVTKFLPNSVPHPHINSKNCSTKRNLILKSLSNSKEQDPFWLGMEVSHMHLPNLDLKISGRAFSMQNHYQKSIMLNFQWINMWMKDLVKILEFHMRKQLQQMNMKPIVQDNTRQFLHLERITLPWDCRSQLRRRRLFSRLWGEIRVNWLQAGHLRMEPQLIWLPGKCRDQLQQWALNGPNLDQDQDLGWWVSFLIKSLDVPKYWAMVMFPKDLRIWSQFKIIMVEVQVIKQLQSILGDQILI